MNIHQIVLTDYIAAADSTSNCIFGLYLGTAGSYGVEQLKVIPSTGWEDLAVTAIFQPCGVKVSVPAAGGVIDVPWEATADELPYPKGRILFQGYAEGKLVNSCDIIYTVSGHSATDGAEGQPPPTPQPGGSDGGYYFPTVQDGVLSWQPSKADMPPAESANVQGPKGEPGIPGADGKNGAPGADGITPTIGANGNWYLGDVDTGKPSCGEQGPQGEKGDPGEPGLGVPQPTLADAGKVPVVNAEGTGYVLREVSAGGGDAGQPGTDGEDGGYYTPSVDTAGNLSWTPSKVGMPSVPEANIRGPEGPQGEPGADGKDGERGPQGEPGKDGKDGPQGPEGPPYTLTEEDKQTIVQAVITALPDGDAVSYGAPEPGIVTTDNQYYTAIAAAIRQKLGTSTEYQPSQMAAAIQSIGATSGIPVTFTGNPVVATGTIANQPFEGLKIYGKSTQDGTPSPGSPVPIVSAGDGGSIGINVSGANLYDLTGLVFPITKNGITFSKNQDGSISVSGTNTSQYTNISASITLKPGIYSVSDGSANSAVLARVEIFGSTYKNTAFLVESESEATLKIQVEGLISVDNTIYPMLNFGTVALPYEPFDANKRLQYLTLSITNGLHGVPVTKNGNYTDSTGQQWWSDVKDLAAETETQNVLDITFDGSADENWTVQSGTEIGNRFYIIIRPTVTASDLSNISSLNSLLPLGTNGETYRKTYCYTITGGSISQLYISLSGSEDLDGLRAYLQANPMRILARLVEPTTSPLTSEEITAYNGLRSYANSTVISTSEPVAGMEATVCCDAAKAMDSKVSMAVNDMYADLSGAIREGVNQVE